MRGFRDRAEVEDMIALIDARVQALDAETIRSGRGLSAGLGSGRAASEVAVPGFDRAAMDGYALRAEETFGAGP